MRKKKKISRKPLLSLLLVLALVLSLFPTIALANHSVSGTANGNVKGITPHSGNAEQVVETAAPKEQPVVIETAAPETEAAAPAAADRISVAAAPAAQPRRETPDVEMRTLDATIVWDDENDALNMRPESVLLQIYADGSAYGLPVEVNEDCDWTYHFTVPSGTEVYTADIAGSVDNYYKTLDGLTVTCHYVGMGAFTNKYGTVCITGTKSWDDGSNKSGVRPDSIIVNLLADGVKVASQLVTGPDWSYSFDISDGVPGTGANPVGVNFTITEEPVEKYVLTSVVEPVVIFNDPTEQNGWSKITPCSSLEISDSHDAKSIIVAKKGSTFVVWSADPLAAFEREIIIESLCASINGVSSDVNAYTFVSGMGESGEFGMTVTETDVIFGAPKNWSWFALGVYSRGSADSTASAITNKLEGTSVSGVKFWDDNNDQDGIRPSEIIVNLLANGEKISSTTVTADDNWSWTFSDIEKYADGKLIEYSVSEEPVPGYTPKYDGMNITNVHTPEQIEIPVTKIWDDADDQDGLRPEDITVCLLADGKDTGKTLILSEGNDWNDSFTELDKYADGKEIPYSVAEVNVTGYTSEISGDQAEGFVITNKHVPAKIDIEGKKVWDDNEDQDGKRPDEITVHLLADGKEIDFATVTGPDWTFAFKDLDKFAAGEEIIYTVSEDAVPEYSTQIKGFIITNTHTPGKTSVQVTKAWNDANDQDGKRPESVTITLFADGEDTGKTLMLSELNSWTDTFTELDEYASGKKIVYTVAEDEVADYTVKITGDQYEGYIVTNTHKPEKIDIAGSKTWDDNNDQDGKRPDEITVILLANGEECAKANVSAPDWAWSFKALDKYADGEIINYSLAELSVPEYSTKINGFDITNTHTPGKTSVQVTKAWKDANDQDGMRPEDVEIILLADGVATGDTLTLNAGNNWTDTFTELDEYANGEKIVYTIEEVKVPEYNCVISGDQYEGYVVTNSHNPEKIDIAGTKTWIDNNDQDGMRPEEITVILLANGAQRAFATVSAPDWAWSFKDLDKYADGEIINYSLAELSVPEYSTVINGFNITNTHTPGKTSVQVTKAWKDANDQDGKRPEGVTITLYADGKDTGKTLTLSDLNNWTGTFTELDEYANGEKIVYTVTENKVPGYTTVISGDQYEGYIVTNSHAPEKINIAGAKTWDDNNDQDGKRPEEITVILLANGEECITATASAPDWAWSFKDLDKYADGEIINYSLAELSVPEYSTRINGFDITNTHTPGKTSVQVTKSWQDANDQDGMRPEDVIITLFADGEDTGKTLTLSEGNNWSDTFTDLDEYNDGEKIVYTVTENEVANYSTVISGDQYKGYIVTNSHTPEKIDLAGSKTWVDNNNQDGIRPEEITISLLANGTPIETLSVSEADGWAWSFEALDKYAEGAIITYTVTEAPVEGYMTEINGFDITNTHAPEKTGITVNKVWTDGNDQDGIRPNDVTIVLVADGEKTEHTLILSDGNNWNGSFTDLDKFDDGREIEYTISEVAVDGYDNEIFVDETGRSFTVENTHAPELIDIAGTKTWDDNDDQDGKRPESITVRLLANGEEVAVKEVSEADNWSWSFKDLDKYENGVEIVYTLTEDAVEDYSATIDGYDVTNTHTPGKTSVQVTKVWQDADDQDGLRPDGIGVFLLANGEVTGLELELTAENNWTGTFTELDEYANGEKIVYTIAEYDFEKYGYESVISGDQTEGFIVTNSHTPDVIDIAGSKTWDDLDNQDGKRPDSITVRLFANGVEVASKVVTEADDWSWSFTGLAKNAAGEPIVYVISEDAVAGYTATYEGYDITNTHTPGMTSVEVQKVWKDSNNGAGIRPGSVTILLFADGQDTGLSVKLSAKNSWRDTFTDLPEYRDGKKIEYTVEEIEVNGYNTVIRSEGNKFTVTNSHNYIPKTGDASHLALYLSLMGVSAAAIALLLVIAKKKGKFEV